MDECTRREIEEEAQKLLRNAGFSRPPVDPEVLLNHLKLHLSFYNRSDPTILHRVWHQLRIGGANKIRFVKQALGRAADKVRLSGAWLPDARKIVIDEDLPKPKIKWTTLHEIVHTLLWWHKEYFLGDTAQTLDPGIQAQLETEANYGASALLFLGPCFTADAMDVSPRWGELKPLAGRYRASLQTTLRRFVQHTRDVSMLAVVSTPSWKRQPKDQKTRCRHVVPSDRFLREFGMPPAGELVALIDSGTHRARGGVVGDFSHGLVDRNGVVREFSAETFFNTHYLMTLFVERTGRPRSIFKISA